MSKKLPYPPDAAKQYPPGTKPDRRRIKSCSDSGAWYQNMIGEIITVHYFVTFGAWDTKGRWLWYYDLSAPIIRYRWFKKIVKKLKSLFKKIFG